jgi:hypothetical protein
MVSTTYGDTTFKFQNGANGYSGAQDFSINTQYSQYNGGNGVQWLGDPELGCYTTTGTGAYSVRYLLKFGGLTIPAGSRVVSAALTMSLDSWNQGSGNITGLYLNNTWNAASKRLGWLHRDDTNDWAGAGASAAGFDTIAQKSFRVPPLSPIGPQTVTIPLDASVVQSWVDSVTANQGIMLINNNTGEIVRPVSTVGAQNMRPLLSIVTSGVSGVQISVSPTSVILRPGGTQTFAGTVTGSSNTAVTWTATGGTVSSGGVYTAGSTSGNFTVTATPAADTTKSATATVSIQPIRVTVSPTSVALQPGATQQFSATVTGSSNTAVTWTATGGTISSTGLYTAGGSGGTFSVTAKAAADPTQTGTAAVTVNQHVTVNVLPTTVTLQPGMTQQFAATVTGSANTAATWTATGGTVSASGLYTAGATAGSYSVTATSVQDSTKSASATITIVTQSNSAHPRIILDAPTLATLRTRAQTMTPEWTAMKAVCDSFTGGGTVAFPGGNGYPDPPSVGEGYQGDGYVSAIMPLGLCYQSTLVSDPTTAAKYGAKGVAILMAMSDPGHTMVDGAPVWDRDSGYGIRNYGFAMGIGYDWFHDLMTPAQLAQVQTSLTNWINGFENDSFEYDHPQGNYFAGYYVAKCMAALAVQGDSPLGDTWWNDWYNHQHLQRVQPYYAANLGGGGWTEGFTQYGILATRNQSLPALAVRTAKGIDIIHGAQPYPFPLDTGRWLMAFTWPTRDMVDDRGELYNTDDVTIWPGTARLESYRFFAGFLSMWGDPSAPMMHKYARDVKSALDAIHAGDSPEWLDFLFWDGTAQDAPDYSSLPMSYLAPGMGGVTARSDWSTGATFMSFISGPYINNPAAGHESFDKGSLAIERNKNPMVVNPEAWLTHEPNGSAGWNVTYDDRYGNWDADHTVGNRILYNTFQVRHLDTLGNILDNYGEWALQRSDGVRTDIGRYEDGGIYALAVGQFLEDMYRPFQTICAGKSPITSWSRQIVYLRPSQFVVYDRTGICDASLDQYLAFHFPANPVEVTAPAPGLHRFDVNTGQFAGSMTTILPANAATITTSQFSSDTTTWNKLWRTEIRATDARTTTRRWMTVFDLAPTAAQVASATGISVTGGLAVGALLSSPAGNNVVISGTAPVGTDIAGAFSYTVPAAATRHVITDLTPSAKYAVAVTVMAGNHLVTVMPGGNTAASANGVLSFGVTAGGQLQP